ncbi:hypothetical protein SDJN03_14486, partial [Cucurbita argyrosperma subsp. sororia]
MLSTLPPPPPTKWRFPSPFTTLEDEEGSTEFDPFDGAEDGDGNFLGNICSQYALGTLAASDETETKATTTVKNKTNLRLKERNMMEMVDLVMKCEGFERAWKETW